MFFQSLIKKGFDLIKMDKIIIAPYIIYALILSLSRSIEIATIYTIVLHWLMDTFFMAITIFMAVCLYKRRLIPIQEIILGIKKTYFKLLIITSITVLPSAWLLQKAVQIYQLTKDIPIGYAVTLVIFIPISICLMFAPTILIEGSKGSWEAIKLSVLFTRRHIKTLMLFLMTVIFINTLTLLVSAIVLSFPVIGESVLAAIIQGISYSFLSILTVLFFIEKNTEKRVSIKV